LLPGGDGGDGGGGGEVEAALLYGLEFRV